MKKNLFLLFVTIIVLLILSEIGARIWDHFRPSQKYGDLGGYSYSPYLPYTPTPKFSDSTRVLNSRGFRNDAVFQIPKPDNVYRIICLGGSSTYDDYNDQPDNNIWTGRLYYYLNQSANGKQIEVINASAHNYTTYMNFIDYLTRCRDLQADMLIIYEGINEVYFNCFDSISFAHYNVFQPFDFKYSERYYNLNHNLFLKNSVLLKLLYIKFFINTQNLNFMSTKKVHNFDYELLKNAEKDSLLTFRKGLEGFIAVCNMDKCKLVFLSQAYNFNNFTNGLNINNAGRVPERIEILKKETIRVKTLMEETARKYDVPFLDMNLLLNSNDLYFASSIDPVHFSKEGSDFFAKELSNFLKSNKLEVLKE